VPTDTAAMLEELKIDSERHGHRDTVAFHGQPEVSPRPAAFRRCLANLVSSAARSHGGDITLGDSPQGGLRAAVRVPV